MSDNRFAPVHLLDRKFHERATFAIGQAGAANAALFAVAMLAPEYPAVRDALDAFRIRQTEDVADNDDPRK